MVFPVESTPLISQKKLTSYNVQGPLFVIVNNDARGPRETSFVWRVEDGSYMLGSPQEVRPRYKTTHFEMSYQAKKDALLGVAGGLVLGLTTVVLAFAAAWYLVQHL
jgi:hypothetical protein